MANCVPPRAIAKPGRGVEALRVQADQLRALLPGEQERLTGETFPADHYRALAEQSPELAAVPEPRLRVTDEMFLQEEERLTGAARSRSDA